MLHLVYDALRRTAYCMIAFLAFLILTPNLPPYDVGFLGMTEPKLIPFQDGLEQNHRLENAEPLSRGIRDSSSLGYLKGPESFAVQGDYLYTGVQGGDILRLNINDPKKPWEFVTKIGELCQDTHHENICGRPLGLEFDKDGNLIIADAYYGLYKVNLKTDKKTPLVPSTLEINGKKNLITNSLVLSQDSKTIYYTVSSTNFHLTNGMYEIMSMPSGRVLKYDVYGNMSKVIMEELSFANGIALSKQEDFLLVNECGASRIWRYWLKGEKRGQKEIFAHTPGTPDNIRLSEDGKFLVGIIVPYFEKHRSYIMTKVLANPVLAKVIVRLYCFIQSLLIGFNKHIAYIDTFAVMIHRLGNTEHSGANMLPSYGLVIEYDTDGNVVQSWHSTDPMMSKICEGFLHNGYMYLGSPYNMFAARVPYYH